MAAAPGVFIAGSSLTYAYDGTVAGRTTKCSDRQSWDVTIRTGLSTSWVIDITRETPGTSCGPLILGFEAQGATGSRATGYRTTNVYSTYGGGSGTATGDLFLKTSSSSAFATVWLNLSYQDGSFANELETLRGSVTIQN